MNPYSQVEFETNRYSVPVSAEQEVSRREQNGREQRIKSAHFPVVKEVADFDFSSIPKLNKTKVLQLAEGGYIPKSESVIMFGRE